MSNFNNTQEISESLISRLYALRAGLSVAANEATEAKRIQNEINQLNEHKQDEIVKVEYTVQGAQNNVNRCLADIQGANDSLAKSIEYKQIALKNYRRELFKRLWIVILPAIIFIVFLILYLKYGDSIFKIYGIGAAILTLITTIILMCNSELRFCQKNIKMANSSIHNNKICIKRYEKNLPELEKRLRKLQNEKQGKLDAINRDFNAQIQKKQEEFAVYINAGSIFCENLDNQFNSLIDRRDWKYVDYIIFCLETRRAETLKESLRLADEENRTQRLENAIQQASSNLQTTLNKKFQQLQNTVSNEMDSLRRTVQSGFASQSVAMQSMSNQLGNIQSSVNDRLNQITAMQHVNNTLMRNIAYNSYLIAQDCNYLAQSPRFL